MNHTKIASQIQADVYISNKIDDFFDPFHVSTTLHCCGIRKRHGYSVRSLIKPIFFLPFFGKNFMPATIVNISQHLPVICMVKKTPKVLYGFEGRRCDLMAIYRHLKKRWGRAKILVSVIVKLKGEHRAKVVFVRDRSKKDWLALLSTDIHLPDEDIVRIYGKRWDNGVRVADRVVVLSICVQQSARGGKDPDRQAFRFGKARQG